jgi:hypothetical protein
LRDATGVVKIDDRVLPLDELGPVPITYQAVAGNPVTYGSGEFEAYACGLWFTEAELGPGDHMLTIDGSSGGFSVSVTYELTVSAT